MTSRIISSEKGKVDLRQLHLTWAWWEHCLRLVCFSCHSSGRCSLISKKSFVCWMISHTSALNSQVFSSTACRHSFQSCTHPISIYSFRWSMWESRLRLQERFTSPQDRPLDRLIGLRLSLPCPCTGECTPCDQYLNELLSSTFVLTVLHARINCLLTLLVRMLWLGCWFTTDPTSTCSFAKLRRSFWSIVSLMVPDW